MVSLTVALGIVFSYASDIPKKTKLASAEMLRLFLLLKMGIKDVIGMRNGTSIEQFSVQGKEEDSRGCRHASLGLFHEVQNFCTEFSYL